MTAKNQTSQTTKQARLSVRHFFSPASCALAQDIIWEKNENLSLFRLIDFVQCTLPALLPLWFVSELYYNENLSATDYATLDASFELRLINPHGKIISLLQMAPTPPDPAKPLTLQRFIVNLSGAIKYENEGTYTFELHGRLNQDAYEPLLSRNLKLQKLDAPVLMPDMLAINSSETAP